MRICVTVCKPVAEAFAASESVNEVALAMDLMVTVSGVDFVAVKVTPEALLVAAVFNVNDVALFTLVATASLAGIPVPEMTVPAESDTGVEVVTVVLPAVTVPTNVVVVTVVVGIPDPEIVMPVVRSLVDEVVTVVLPEVVVLVMVEVLPVVVTYGLPELWHITQKVALEVAL
jgi:hypothetical protein